VLRHVWEEIADQPYRPASLAGEGFIHCSFAHQVTGSANRFYVAATDLLLLHIDAERLTSPLKEDSSGTGEIFPHIYGPLNRESVITVETLTRGPDGRWQFTDS
jgi:uncharacterized protein (DUF952 family)